MDLDVVGGNLTAVDKAVGGRDFVEEDVYEVRRRLAFFRVDACDRVDHGRLLRWSEAIRCDVANVRRHRTRPGKRRLIVEVKGEGGRERERENYLASISYVRLFRANS